jgi:hypothetical protein
MPCVMAIASNPTKEVLFFGDCILIREYCCLVLYVMLGLGLRFGDGRLLFGVVRHAWAWALLWWREVQGLKLFKAAWLTT